MVPILINKDVFEPSYNDLKFSPKLQVLLYQPNKIRRKEDILSGWKVVIKNAIT